MKSYYDTTTGHARYTATPPPLPLPVCVHKFVCDATILCHVTTPPPWKPSPSFCGRNAAAGGLTMCKGEFPGFSHLRNPWRQPKRFSCKRGVGPLAASGGENTRVQFPNPPVPGPPTKEWRQQGATLPWPPSLPFGGGGGGPHRVMTFQFPPTPTKKLVFFGQGGGAANFCFSEPQPPTPTRRDCGARGTCCPRSLQPAAGKPLYVFVYVKNG